MCNASISQGKFPAAHKSAIVRPRLKKPSLDTADLNSYRPISNLSIVSKVLERIIDSRLTEHAISQRLFTQFQSVYCKYYSTENALVTVHNDLICAVDQGNVGALALLDLFLNNIRLLKIDKPQLNTQMLKVKVIHSTNIKLKEKHHQ